VGLALNNQEWIRSRIKVESVRVPTAPAAESPQRALEAQASRVVAEQQSAAIAWLHALETWIPDGADVRAPSRLTLAAFTAPDAFLLRGLARNEAALSAFQETLVLAPGMDVRRSELQPVRQPGRGALEFLFSGSFAPSETTSGDSVPPVNRVSSPTQIDATLQRFVENAAAAGIEWTSLPAPAPTASGALKAIAYRLSAKLSDTTAAPRAGRLRAFLENEHHRDSPFGIQRVLMEMHRDSAMVFLDIMAFSR
jgi:hypothetical protein